MNLKKYLRIILNYRPLIYCLLNGISRYKICSNFSGSFYRPKTYSYSVKDSLRVPKCRIYYLSSNLRFWNIRYPISEWWYDGGKPRWQYRKTVFMYRNIQLGYRKIIFVWRIVIFMYRNIFFMWRIVRFKCRKMIFVQRNIMLMLR
jgi:hypothetical protein